MKPAGWHGGGRGALAGEADTPAASPAAESVVAAAADLRSLRVCHLIGSLRVGGAERQVVNLLNNLPFAHRYVLLLEPPCGDGLAGELDSGVDLGVAPLRLRSLPGGVLRIAWRLRRWRIDVLHTHTFWPSLVGSLAGRLARVPVIVTSEHGKNLWKTWFHRWAERRLISPLADLRLCASEDIRRLRREWEGVPAEKLLHVPNGTELAQPFQRPDNAVPIIGSVGRLVPAKDYPTLIRAAAILRERGLAFRLHLVGDGPERARLERLVRRQGLQEMVGFAGMQPRISEWMRRFDLFVLSSIREGQPLSLLEAMAHGLPIVATRVGGVPLTVAEGEEAVLVDPADPCAIADALQDLLLDPGRRARLGNGARRRLERDFTIQAVTARYARIYKELWDRKHEAG